MLRNHRVAPAAGDAEAQLIVGRVFQGYNSFLDEVKLPALTGRTERFNSPVKQSGLAITASFSEYLKSINVSSSVSYGSLGSSASAKLDYAYSLNVTEQAVYATVYASQTQGTTQVESVSLRGDVPVPGNQDELEQFFTSYGDSWVDSVTNGAEYIATFAFYCQTVEESREVQASLRANNVTWDASIATSLAEVSKETNVRVEISQFLQGVNLTLPSDPSGIYKFASSTFLAAAPDSTSIVSYSIAPYEDVPALSDVFEPIQATRDQFSGTAADPNVSQQLYQLTALSSQVTAIQNVYRLYGYSGDSKLAQQAKQIDTDLKTVTNLVNQMGKDPAQTYTVPDPVSLTYGTPSLNYRLNDYPTPWGEEGGGPFSDATDGYCPAFVESGWAITGITLAGAAWMDWIQIKYTALDGSSVTLQHGGGQPTKVTQETWVIGQPGGTATLGTRGTRVIGQLGYSVSKTLPLKPPTEVVTSIWAMWGKFLNQLNISTTNPQNSLKYPPNPRNADNTDTWKAAPNQVLAAFQGRAGAYVDQLQVVYLTFSPANWAEPASQPR